jgi:hypothetical protein
MKVCSILVTHLHRMPGDIMLLLSSDFQAGRFLSLLLTIVTLTSTCPFKLAGPKVRELKIWHKNSRWEAGDSRARKPHSETGNSV